MLNKPRKREKPPPQHGACTEPLPDHVLPAEAAPERRQRKGRGAGDLRRDPARPRDGAARQEVRRAASQVLQQDRGLHRLGEGGGAVARGGGNARAIFEYGTEKR